MGLFDKIDRPIVYNDSIATQEEINRLKRLSNTEENSLKIKLLEQGLKGEKKVLYELKNSHIGMYILHDLYVRYDNLDAQIDFVVITHKHVYYIECKNLVGDIEIDQNGNFIRITNHNNNIKREGIYNPLTQCKRHADIFKSMSMENSDPLYKYNVNKNFYKHHIPLVVLANDETILNDKYAPDEVRKQVIRADKLIDYIKDCDESKDNLLSDAAMLEVANNYMNVCTTRKSAIKVNDNKFINVDKLRKELKEYRCNKAKEHNDKPYYIFNNYTLEKLISVFPTNKNDLYKVSGFGTIKIEKYGDDIISIIKKYY